jgi:pilus assembly protein CpaE
VAVATLLPPKAPPAALSARHGAFTVLAIARSQEVKNALASAFSGLHGTDLDIRIGELKTTGAQIVHTQKPDIVVLDVDIEDEQELWALSRIVHERAGIGPVLATASSITAESARRLIRQGVDDFIPQPMTTHDVLDALEVAHRKLRQVRGAGRLGKVFTFLKAAGGMGSTTLAVHTAYNLLHPRKGESASVCLLDLDLHFGTAALYLDLKSNPEIVELVRAPGRLDGELLRNAMSVHASGLHVFGAPTTPVPLEALTAETVGKLLNLAREEYDYVVVDLPPALTGWLDTTLSQSHQILLVTQLTVAAIRQTRRLLDIFSDEGLYSLPLAVVLNRFQRRWGERVRVKEGERALGRRFDYIVGSDYQLMVDALNQGKPLYDVKWRCRVGRHIQALTTGCLAAIAERELAASAPALGPGRP